MAHDYNSVFIVIDLNVSSILSRPLPFAFISWTFPVKARVIACHLHATAVVDVPLPDDMTHLCK